MYDEEGNTTSVTNDVTAPEEKHSSWTFNYIDNAEDLADGELDNITQTEGDATWTYAEHTYNEDGKLLSMVYG